MIRKYNKRENCGNINRYVKPNCHNSVVRRPNLAHAVILVAVNHASYSHYSVRASSCVCVRFDVFFLFFVLSHLQSLGTDMCLIDTEVNNEFKDAIGTCILSTKILVLFTQTCFHDY